MTPIEPDDPRHDHEPRSSPSTENRCKSLVGQVTELINELRRISDIGSTPRNCKGNDLKMWKDENDLYFEIEWRGRTKLDADITILNEKLYVRVSI